MSWKLNRGRVREVYENLHSFLKFHLKVILNVFFDLFCYLLQLLCFKDLLGCLYSVFFSLIWIGLEFVWSNRQDWKLVLKNARFECWLDYSINLALIDSIKSCFSFLIDSIKSCLLFLPWLFDRSWLKLNQSSVLFLL